MGASLQTPLELSIINSINSYIHSKYNLLVHYLSLLLYKHIYIICVYYIYNIYVLMSNCSEISKTQQTIIHFVFES